MATVAAELSTEEYRLILGLLLLAAIASFYFFARNWKRVRLIENTPTARLRSAPQGYVELIGKTQGYGDQPIYAPLSNHPCLWYHSQIDQQETFTENGRSQTRWNTVYQNVSDHRFKLIDGDSYCYVDPSDAEVRGNEKLVWYGNTEWPTRTQILESQSIALAMKHNYRYSEQLILPGQSLYILGQFRTCSAIAEQSVRDVMINLIDDWKKDQTALKHRFDTNRDGAIDQIEWESARQQAHTEAQKIHAQLALEPDENIITQPNDPKRPFIISVYPQSSLARHYKKTSHWSLTACVALLGITIWLIHARGL